MTRFDFTTNGFPRFRIFVSARNTSNSNSNDRVFDDDYDNLFKMRVGLFDVVEFEDNNGNGQYDIGNDTVVSQIHLFGQSSSWSSIVEDSTTDANNVTMYTFTTNLDDIVVIRAKITDGNLAQSGIQFSPDSIKFDFEIHNYPFASSSSMLALVSGIDIGTDDHHHRDDSDNDDNVAVQTSNIDGSTYSGGFSWTNTVNVDGTDASVASSTLMDASSQWNGFGGDDDEDENEQRKLIVFSFPRGNSVQWDPEIYASGSMVNAVVSIGVVFVALFAFFF